LNLERRKLPWVKIEKEYVFVSSAKFMGRFFRLWEPS
jgi:predicted dithiol-disulfide oxidoreductase (DUF899 family)